MDETWMREAIGLALEGAKRGDGGPFGAVVVREGAIVGRGWNQVLATNDPTAHAEIVAIREAAARLGNYHLQGCTIYASCEPCPMCLAASYWAQVDRIVYGATAEDAAQVGFADDFIRRELLQGEARSLPLVPLLRDEALGPFEYWAQKPDKQMY